MCLILTIYTKTKQKEKQKVFIFFVIRGWRQDNTRLAATHFKMGVIVAKAKYSICDWLKKLCLIQLAKGLRFAVWAIQTSDPRLIFQGKYYFYSNISLGLTRM